MSALDSWDIHRASRAAVTRRRPRTTAKLADHRPIACGRQDPAEAQFAGSDLVGAEMALGRQGEQEVFRQATGGGGVDQSGGGPMMGGRPVQLPPRGGLMMNGRRVRLPSR